MYRTIKTFKIYKYQVFLNFSVLFGTVFLIFLLISKAKLWYLSPLKCNKTKLDTFSFDSYVYIFICIENRVNVVHLSSFCGIAGSKRIFAGDFSRGICLHNRFQPFLFWTNGSMSDCVFVKSTCNEEGQLVYKDDSTKDDTACRCNHKNGFSFIKTPNNNCFCKPTEEDCSCYDTSCQPDCILSAGSLFTFCN